MQPASEGGDWTVHPKGMQQSIDDLFPMHDGCRWTPVFDAITRIGERKHQSIRGAFRPKGEGSLDCYQAVLRRVEIIHLEEDPIEILAIPAIT